jgi:hypothetical protein
MKKAILASLLLFGATGPVSAESLSDRFRDDFADTPLVSVSPDAGAPPIVAPKLEYRPARAIVPVPTPSAGRALPLVPTPDSRAAEMLSPAVKAIKPFASLPGEAKVDISWNPTDTQWDGMFIKNSGEKPFSVLAMRLDNRSDCQLKPYNLDKIRAVIDLSQAIKTWGFSAVNLFGLPKMENVNVLIPELPPDLQKLGIRPEDATLKAGGRIAVFNGTKCDSVKMANVDTNIGSLAIKFNAPYTGH